MGCSASMRSVVGLFIAKVFSRPDCGGLLIVHPGVTPAAAVHVEEARGRGRTVIIVTVVEIFEALRVGNDIEAMLSARRVGAILDKGQRIAK